MSDKAEETAGNKVFVNPRYRYYTVKVGDDLRAISSRVYGSPDYFLEIARVNNLTNLRELAAGTALVFPPIEKKTE